MGNDEYNQQSAAGQLRRDWNDLEQYGQLGDWSFTANEDHIAVRWPDGTERGYLYAIPISREGDSQHWGWDGNRESPTLSPSIDRHPSWLCPGWHGWMRAGRLESC